MAEKEERVLTGAGVSLAVMKTFSNGFAEGCTTLSGLQTIELCPFDGRIV